MQSQRQLIDVLGKFTPRIVKMDGAKPKPWQKGKAVEGE
jgi:tRNA-splicing ligase RtcB